MYHNNPMGPSSASSEPSFSANNPFLESSASNRFPALDTSQPSYQSASLYSPQRLSPPPSQFLHQSLYIPPQQSQQQYTPSWNSHPPQSPTFQQGAFSGYVTSQQPYQPAGILSYGQQFGQASNFGPQPPPLQLQAQYTGFIPNQLPQASVQQQQNVLSQFDPYSGSSGSTISQNDVQGGLVAMQPQRTGPAGQLHPRQFIHAHKAELESWNATVWRQALQSFEGLKRSWEQRRIDLQKYLQTGHYLTVEDITNVNGMIKASESNIDAVMASLIQMQEVQTGYKHSLDAAGKQRVKEALNAGLQVLPDWP